MLVTMKHTALGSQDGFKIENFEVGKTYDIASSLAFDLVARGKADYTKIIDGCTNPIWYDIFAENKKASEAVI